MEKIQNRASIYMERRREILEKAVFAKVYTGEQHYLNSADFTPRKWFHHYSKVTIKNNLTTLKSILYLLVMETHALLQ